MMLPISRSSRCTWQSQLVNFSTSSATTRQVLSLYMKPSTAMWPAYAPLLERSVCTISGSFIWCSAVSMQTALDTDAQASKADEGWGSVWPNGNGQEGKSEEGWGSVRPNSNVQESTSGAGDWGAVGPAENPQQGNPIGCSSSRQSVRSSIAGVPSTRAKRQNWFASLSHEGSHRNIRCT